MAGMLARFGIAQGLATALIVALVGPAPAAAAQPGWKSTAPVEYLEYDLPYSKLPLVSFTAYKYSQPEHRLAFGRYKGLYNYAPSSVAGAPPMVGAAATPFIAYDLTPY
jgi:hypothetical protein